MISERMAKRYAGVVTKQDVEYLLFSLLDTERLSAVSRISGLTRRTLYKLKDRADIRTKTKLKILRASFEASPSDVFSFLVERYKGNAAGVLMSYLSYLYNEALQSKQPAEFELAFSKFLDARSKNFGLISDEVENEVETMFRFLDESATRFGVPTPLESLRTTNREHLLKTLPLLVSSLQSGDNSPLSVARLFDVPIEWVQSVSTVTKDVPNRLRPEEPWQVTAATNILPKEPSFYDYPMASLTTVGSL